VRPIFELLGLLDLQPAVFLAPAIEGLIGDSGLLSRSRNRLALPHQHFDLPQFGHNLLGRKESKAGVASSAMAAVYVASLQRTNAVWKGKWKAVFSSLRP
jgi:hypothetical protein